MQITISEESGKINVNGLVQQNGDYELFTQGVLQRLGTRLKLKVDITPAIADWIDSNDQPRSGGVESASYRTLKSPYSARNGKIMTLTELSLVEGIRDSKPDILGMLRPYLTTFSDQANSPLPTVNINTAPLEIVAALDKGIDDRMAERIVAERRIQPFKSIGELSRVPGLDTIATGLGGRITVKGNLFRITSVAKVKDSGRTVEAVVRLSGSMPQILSWQEY